MTRAPADEEPFSALAFKVMSDKYVGTLTFCRVYRYGRFSPFFLSFRSRESPSFASALAACEPSVPLCSTRMSTPAPPKDCTCPASAFLRHHGGSTPLWTVTQLETASHGLCFLVLATFLWVAGGNPERSPVAAWWHWPATRCAPARAFQGDDIYRFPMPLHACIHCISLF